MINKKIKVSSLLEFIAFIDLLCWYHFFYIVSFPSSIEVFLSKHNYTIVSSILGLFCSIICISTYKKTFAKQYRLCAKYGMLIIFVYLIIVAYTMIYYSNLALYDVIRLGGNYLHLFWVPTYVYIIYTSGGIKEFLKKINLICFIWYVLVISQFIVYNLFGKSILGFASLIQNSSVRIYGLRLAAGCFGAIMILYNYIQLYDHPQKKEKIFSIIQIFLGLITVIYVQQTRMIVVTVLVCALFCVLICKKSKKVRNRELVFLGIAVLLLYFSHYFDNVYYEFIKVDSTEGGVSITNRLYSLSYYWHCFLKNPLMGNGFVTETTDYFNIVHGNLGTAYYSDVGVVGALGQIGLCLVVFFACPYIYILKTVRIARQKKMDTFEFNILLISAIYICVTAFTLLITDNGRELLFSVILSLSMYYRNQCIKGSTH